MRQVSQGGEAVTMYFHPWEFDPEQPRIKTNAISAFRHYLNIKGNDKKLSAIMRGNEFMTVAEYGETCRRHCEEGDARRGNPSTEIASVTTFPRNDDKIENPDLSIVIPIFNEEECVEKLYERVHAEAAKLGRTYEILLIDDGSTDSTPRILKDLVRKVNDLRVIRFRKNYGQTPAMVAGFDNARGEVIITMDGDLQNDPADMKKLLDKMAEGYEVVSGWRYKRQDKFITRKLPSMCANKLISILTGVHLHDYGCSLKAYKRDCIREVQAYGEMHRFFPAIASITGARTAEIPVNHYARKYGKSKYGLSRTFKVFSDLFTMLLLTRFSTQPAIFFAFWALPFFILSILCVFATIRHYIYAYTPGIVLPGTTLLMLMLVTHFVLLALLSVIILRQGQYKVEKLSSITAKIIE